MDDPQPMYENTHSVHTYLNTELQAEWKRVPLFRHQLVRVPCVLHKFMMHITTTLSRVFDESYMKYLCSSGAQLLLSHYKLGLLKAQTSKCQNAI